MLASSSHQPFQHFVLRATPASSNSSSSCLSSSSCSSPCISTSSTTSSPCKSSMMTSSCCDMQLTSVPPAAHKRMRFSPSQIHALESMYEENPFPSRLKKQQLATAIGRRLSNITIWFENRRRKERAQQAKKAATSSSSSSSPSIAASSDDHVSTTSSSSSVTAMDTDADCLLMLSQVKPAKMVFAQPQQRQQQQKNKAEMYTAALLYGNDDDEEADDCSSREEEEEAADESSVGETEEETASHMNTAALIMQQLQQQEQQQQQQSSPRRVASAKLVLGEPLLAPVVMSTLRYAVIQQHDDIRCVLPPNMPAPRLPCFTEFMATTFGDVTMPIVVPSSSSTRR